MATSPQSSASSPSPRSPIRVVPVRLDVRLEAPAPGPAPHLTYRGGPLLTAVQVFTFFWGDGWQAETDAALMQQIMQFFDFVVTSPLMDQLGEYSASGSTIGHGSSSAPRRSPRHSDPRSMTAQSRRSSSRRYRRTRPCRSRHPTRFTSSSPRLASRSASTGPARARPSVATTTTSTGRSFTR